MFGRTVITLGLAISSLATGVSPVPPAGAQETPDARAEPLEVVESGGLTRGQLANLYASLATERVAAALHGVTVLIGDRLGLYVAMADGRLLTAARLVERTGTALARVEAWLVCQVAAGYVVHEPSEDTYRLAPEHAALAGDGGSLAAGFQIVAAAFKDEPRITEAFRTGDPAPGHGHHPDLDAGLERFGGSAAALPEPIAVALCCLYGEQPTHPRAGDRGGDR